MMNKVYFENKPLHGKSVVFAIVDQANIKIKHFNLYEKMLDITKFYTNKFQSIVDCKILYFDNIDQALNSCDETDIMIIQSISNHIFSNVFVEYIDDYIKENPEFFLIGFTLDWQDDRWLELHNQMIVMNMNKWKELGRPSYGGWEKKEEFLPNYSRSIENFHDHYTPYWIKGEPGNTLCRHGRQGWNILKTALEAGIKIDNFTQEMRNCRLYLYPEADSEIFWNCIQLKQPIDNMNPNQKKWIKSFTQPSQQIWVYNSERYSFPHKVKNLKTYIGPCAGFKFLDVLKYSDDIEFVFYDFNVKSIEWLQFLRQNWNGREFLRFIKKQDQWKKFYKFINKDIDDNQRILLEEFGGEEQLYLLWQKFLNCKVVFTVANLYEKESLERLSNYVSGKTLFYYSNIFATDYMIRHHMLTEIITSHNKTIDIFLSKKNVILYGTDPLSQWVIHQG